MSEKKMTSIGGQAILEGVMMRGPHKMAMAVRKADGEIVIEEKEVKKHPIIAKIPLVRGVFSFFSSLVIGIQAINFSAKFFDLTEEEKAEIARKEAEKAAKNPKKASKKSKIFLKIMPPDGKPQKIRLFLRRINQILSGNAPHHPAD